MTTVELVGLPAVGKSTVAGHLAERLRMGGADAALPGEGRLIDALRGLTRQPRVAVRVFRAAVLLVRSVDGPLRARVRRALRVVRRVLVLAGSRRRAGWAIHDEGPINWALANRWRNAAAMDRYLRLVAACYVASDVRVVVLDAPSERILRQRAERRASRPSTPRARRHAGRSRRRRRTVVSWEERSARFPSVLATLHDAGLDTLRVPVGQVDSAADLAARSLAGLVSGTRGERVTPARAARPAVVLLCSPHLGILDNWLPVLDTLRDRHADHQFVIVIPDAGTMRSVAADDPLVEAADRVFDRWVFSGPRGTWRSTADMRSTAWPRTLARAHVFTDRVGRWAARGGRMGRAGVSRATRILWAAAGSRLAGTSLDAVDTARRAHGDFDVARLSVHGAVLCYCLSSEAKPALRELLRGFDDSPRFSIYHGGINTVVPASRRAEVPLTDLAVRSFLVAEAERQALVDRFGLRADTMRTVGIVRHDPRWMDTMRVVSGSRHRLRWPRFVLLVSRPTDADGLPRERKERALRDLREIVIEGLGLPVVVKTHPKQGYEGLYEAVFGAENYGRTWAYTRAHPFHLAQGCEFAVSFGSAIDVDMVVSGVPTIDRRDRRGLPNYDTPEAVRDDRGRILDSFATVGMVLVAETTADFREHVDEIMRDRAGVVSRLQAAYRDVFGEAADPVAAVADEISEAIERLAARS